MGFEDTFYFGFLGMVELSIFIAALSNEAINIYNKWHEWSQQVLNVWKSPKSGAHPTDFTGIVLVIEFSSLGVLFTMTVRGLLQISVWVKVHLPILKNLYIKGYRGWCLEQQCESQKTSIWILLARLPVVNQQNQMTCDFKNTLFTSVKGINAAFRYCWQSMYCCIFKSSTHG